jgi:radical SAM superfamily enzyme YgiQ (UPF0313 family)
LFRVLIPLNLLWVGEMSLSALEDEELLDLAAESGCMGLGLGFESLSTEVIASIRKHRTNQPARYKELVGRVHQRGIAIEGYLIIGFDEDGPDVFERLADFVYDCNIEAPGVNTLTPYPGTRIFRQYEHEDRLLHRNWALYDTAAGFVVYEPKQMSADELREGYLWTKERLFSPKSIVKRLICARTWKSTPLSLHFNRQWRRSFQEEKALVNLPAH